MARLHPRLMLTIIFLILVTMLLTMRPATSQPIETLQPGFSQAISMIHEAEASGAEPSELAGLVSLLNKALELNRQAQTMSAPDQADKRAALLTQVDQTLANVDDQSAQIATTSSQRVFINRILTYTFGAIAAVLGTLILAFASSVYRKYRIKRTFQMRIQKK